MRFGAHTGLVEQCQKRAWSIELKLIEYRNTAGSALGFRPAPPGRDAFSFFCFMLHFLKGYDFGVTLSRLRPGKAFKAAERISSCLEHTLLFASANKNPPTDGLGLADIGTLPAVGAWLA